MRTQACCRYAAPVCCSSRAGFILERSCCCWPLPCLPACLLPRCHLLTPVRCCRAPTAAMTGASTSLRTGSTPPAPELPAPAAPRTLPLCRHAGPQCTPPHDNESSRPRPPSTGGGLRRAPMLTTHTDTHHHQTIFPLATINRMRFLRAAPVCAARLSLRPRPCPPRHAVACSSFLLLPAVWFLLPATVLELLFHASFHPPAPAAPPPRRRPIVYHLIAGIVLTWRFAVGCPPCL